MLEIYTGKDGELKQRDIADNAPVKQKRKDIIVEYMRRFYDADDEQAIINNWIEVRDGEATPPPADIVDKRTKQYRQYQKRRKEAKNYADSVLGEEL